MAPEAILTPDTVGPAADVSGVGIAYFLVTSRPPFAGSNLVQICIEPVHSKPEPPSTRVPSSVPSELDSLVLRCLEKDAERRPMARALGQEHDAFDVSA